MPAIVDSTTISPYIATASTKRSPSPDAQGRVGPPATYLTSVMLHVVQTGIEVTVELAGAIPYTHFLFNTVGGAADIVASDEILIASGPYAGTYRVRGAAQFGSDHTQISAERFTGT